MAFTFKVTALAIVSAFLLLVSWDVYVATNGIRGDTISEMFGVGWSSEYMSLPMAWGVITGHLFWHTPSPITNKWLKVGGLWIIGVVMITLDVFDVIDILPIVPALLGVVIGHYLWPQNTRTEG